MIETVRDWGGEAGVPLGLEVAVPSKEQVNASAGRPAAPPVENPTSNAAVHDWIAGRVAADAQMRSAGAARKAREQEGNG